MDDQIIEEPAVAYTSLKMGYSSADAIDFIERSYIRTVDVAARILGVSKRTVQDWGRKDTRLTTLYGDALVELEEVSREGREAFDGDMSALEEWMRQPLADMDGRTPMDLLDNTIGRKMVINKLIALQHGYFA